MASSLYIVTNHALVLINVWRQYTQGFIHIYASDFSILGTSWQACDRYYYMQLKVRAVKFLYLDLQFNDLYSLYILSYKKAQQKSSFKILRHKYFHKKYRNVNHIQPWPDRYPRPALVTVISPTLHIHHQMRINN